MESRFATTQNMRDRSPQEFSEEDQSSLHHEEEEANFQTHCREKIQIYNNWPHNIESSLLLAKELIQVEVLPKQRVQDHNLNLKKMETDVLDDTVDLSYLRQDLILSVSIANYLKSKVDELRWQDKEKAIVYSDAILRVGKVSNNLSILGLGNMAKGDSIAHLGNQPKTAWFYLCEAGENYLRDGNLIGWARSSIGKIGICNLLEADRINEALEATRLADIVFRYFGETDLLVRLSVNLTKFYYDRGNYAEVIKIFDSVFPIAKGMGLEGDEHLALLFNNVALANRYSGQMHLAKKYFQESIDVLNKLDKLAAKDIVQASLADIDRIHGHYEKSLLSLLTVLHNMGEKISIYKVHVRMNLIKCNILLNRFDQAMAFAKESLDDISKLDGQFIDDRAHTLCLLGESQSKIGKFHQSMSNLSEAIQLFDKTQLNAWKYYASLLKSEAALAQGDYVAAYKLAKKSGDYFQENHQLPYLIRTLLVQAEVSLISNDFKRTDLFAKTTIRLSKRINSPIHKYYGYLLLGKSFRLQGIVRKARRCFWVALNSISEINQIFTKNLRVDFKRDKFEAVNEYLALTLHQGLIEEALTVIEQTKSHLILAKQNHELSLQETQDSYSNQSQDFRDLEKLREDHHFLYQHVHERGLLLEQEILFSVEESVQRLNKCEIQLIALFEKIQLFDKSRQKQISKKFEFDLSEIREALDPDTIVFEYFVDLNSIWCISICRDHISLKKLDSDPTRIESLIEKLLFNISCVLKTKSSRMLNRGVKKIGWQLFSQLVAPFSPQLAKFKKIVFVPYGMLHYLPFNILHSNQNYLIETHEISILPSLTLLKSRKAKSRKGTTIIANSSNGRLPFALNEANKVASYFESDVYIEAETHRQLLKKTPTQILHIAAHGKFRYDRPDLSFIQLDDGQLFIDDLLNEDLSYELIVLSACETGKTMIKLGEEFVGLGHNVLNSGAGAVISSAWPVEDSNTAMLMDYFYSYLIMGESKSASLRLAQKSMLQNQPDLHPAFWGAFQLLGDSAPLSS